MSQDLIKRYKKSIRVHFSSDHMEQKYRDRDESLTRGTSLFAFATLCLISLVFAYLEYRALGVKESIIPMSGFILAAVLAFANACLNQFGKQTYYLNVRLLVNGAFTVLVVMLAVSLHTFSPYYIAELAILLIWMGSLNIIGFAITSLLNFGFIVLFLVCLAFMGKPPVSFFWMILIALVLIASAILSSYISYLMERQRRILFLQQVYTDDMNRRQDAWAFTLIDLDMALSGILDFREMIELLKKYIEPVIRFESYVLTSLEGQGPKPVADKIEGELFEKDSNTIWSQDLLNKLTQTRQSTVSSEHETVKGFMGIERKKFTSFRLDIPVFNDANLMGVISLRRSDEAFDDLDMISGMSIATQAMLIFKRSTKTPVVAPRPAVVIPDPVVRVAKKTEKATPVEKPKKPKSYAEKMESSTTTDFQITENTSVTGIEEDVTGSDEMVAPSALIKKIRADEETTKKTITLLSRENADKVAMDKYRKAAAGGEPLSILIIEVDGLSKLREQDGDQVAYKVFAAIVKYIFSNVDKEKDILGRYGQNGLSVLMPQIDMNAAEKFAEKIRQFVERARYKTAYGEKTATLSIGVAAMTDDTGDYGSMVKRADMALFVAKKNGRNCVKVRL